MLADAQLPSSARPEESREGATSYQVYLREIAETPLLTVAEENILAKRIRKGDEAARERMIRANLRLVVRIARSFSDYGLPLLDLINEGNIGLMKAVSRFDPKKGAKLSTYAAWWIKQAIRRALANQLRDIRLPVHIGEKLFKLRRAETKLHQELEREPTPEELAAELDTQPEKVNRLLNATARPVPLDAPFGMDGAESYAEVIADEAAASPYRELEEKTDAGMIRKLMGELEERERTILSYRFGFDGGRERTLEEVGQEFGITRERVRQIQNLAMARLKKKLGQMERHGSTQLAALAA